MPFDSTLTNAIGTYGAWVVGSAVAVESMGLPVPGETMLVAAALYAGSTGELNIAHVVLAAMIGAIVGDNAGFWIGRTIGVRWVVRHRSRLQLTIRRLKLGQYLFLRHGGKVVFFGRFVAVLRVLAALLAGLNCMNWWLFCSSTHWAESSGLARTLGRLRVRGNACECAEHNWPRLGNCRCLRCRCRADPMVSGSRRRSAFENTAAKRSH